MPCAIHFRNSCSNSIHGKYGNLRSVFCRIDSAFCRNITSCESVISVIIVVLRFPILPQVILTTGSSLMNPQFFASLCRRRLTAIRLRQRWNRGYTAISSAHHGK